MIKQAQKLLAQAGFEKVCSVVSDVGSYILYASPRGDQVYLNVKTAQEVVDFLAAHPDRR
jgi:hypothetical protein